MTQKTHGIAPSSLPSTVFTLVLSLLVAFVAWPVAGQLSYAVVGAIFGAMLLCRLLLPGSSLFSLSIANLVAVYACFFTIILDSHFRAIAPALQMTGFAAPLLAFFLGALLQRRTLRRIIRERVNPAPADFAHSLLWLLLMAIIGIAAMLYASSERSPNELALAFASAMGLSALLAGIASRDITLFLLDTGLLFKDFFQRGALLVAPMFAFFTLYSVTVLLFALVFTSIDHISKHPHFRIMGELRPIAFAESLYFSLITMATVGYGDIIPETNLVRMLSAAEVLCGIALLLFGFNEVLHYTRRQEPPKK